MLKGYLLHLRRQTNHHKRTMNKNIICSLLLTLVSLGADAQQNSVKEQEPGQTADTAIVLNYGYQAIDTILCSKSPDTFRQIREAEAVVQGITDQKAKNRTVVGYVLSHPDSDGSVYLLGHVMGVGNGKKCLSALSERARNGNMKKLYDAYVAGMKEFDEMTAKTREACPIGKEAKDFTLEDINGKQLTLSSLRGRYVMLDFWGSWCVNCIAAFPDMKAFYEHYRDKLEILGVAFHDTKDKWKAAVEKNKLPWKLVIDTEGADSVAERYGIIAAPTYVLIDPEGKVVEWTIGSHESIEEYLMAL